MSRKRLEIEDEESGQETLDRVVEENAADQDADSD